MIETLGWIATAVVVGSFGIQDQRKLRIVNMSGSILWMGYGFLKQDNPIIFVNISIMVMHTYWFIKNKK
ncbi:MAG: SemiSWEET family transporter [Burkholderiaceae bacterium]